MAQHQHEDQASSNLSRSTSETTVATSIGGARLGTPASRYITAGSKAPSSNVSFWRIVFDDALITPDVLEHPYEGDGTEESPYVCEFIPNDPRNPQNWPRSRKWLVTICAALTTFAIAFNSSAYSGAVKQIILEFRCSQEVATLGLSLFVFGYVIGPLLWAPLSELYGRRYLFIGTYMALTAFSAGAPGSKNIATLIVLRAFAGLFGSSPLTNAGGTIADMFSAKERGVATAIFSAAPFLGPAVGPIVGGFAGDGAGWRWVMGIMAILAGTLWILGIFTLPETYAPVILERRARALEKATGKVFSTRIQLSGNRPSAMQAFKTALGRPWVLLFREPIVLAMSIYMAIVYGTLYMMFGAFPIVFQQGRGWSEGVGGLAFIGVLIGMLGAVAYAIPDNTRRYARAAAKARERGERLAPPEARLPPSIIGGIALPIGLFWFAWTNGPNIHWIVPIIASVPFGFGMVLVFLSIMNYLVDSYTIYAASVLAANSVLRSLFGTAFPLFTTQMYQNLGIHWASSVPAFLALACAPFPILFYKYGATLRRRCRYAREAEDTLAKMMEGLEDDDDDDHHNSGNGSNKGGEEDNAEKKASSSFSPEETLRRQKSRRDQRDLVRHVSQGHIPV